MSTSTVAPMAVDANPAQASQVSGCFQDIIPNAFNTLGLDPSKPIALVDFDVTGCNHAHLPHLVGGLIKAGYQPVVSVSDQNVKESEEFVDLLFRSANLKAPKIIQGIQCVDEPLWELATLKELISKHPVLKAKNLTAAPSSGVGIESFLYDMIARNASGNVALLVLGNSLALSLIEAINKAFVDQKLRALLPAKWTELLSSGTLKPIRMRLIRMCLTTNFTTRLYPAAKKLPWLRHLLGFENELHVDVHQIISGAAVEWKEKTKNGKKVLVPNNLWPARVTGDMMLKYLKKQGNFERLVLDKTGQRVPDKDAEKELQVVKFLGFQSKTDFDAAPGNVRAVEGKQSDVNVIRNNASDVGPFFFNDAPQYCVLPFDSTNLGAIKFSFTNTCAFLRAINKLVPLNYDLVKLGEDRFINKAREEVLRGFARNIDGYEVKVPAGADKKAIEKQMNKDIANMLASDQVPEILFNASRAIDAGSIETIKELAVPYANRTDIEMAADRYLKLTGRISMPPVPFLMLCDVVRNPFAAYHLVEGKRDAGGDARGRFGGDSGTGKPLSAVEGSMSVSANFGFKSFPPDKEAEPVGKDQYPISWPTTNGVQVDIPDDSPFIRAVNDITQFYVNHASTATVSNGIVTLATLKY